MSAAEELERAIAESWLVYTEEREGALRAGFGDDALARGFAHLIARAEAAHGVMEGLRVVGPVTAVVTVGTTTVWTWGKDGDRWVSSSVWPSGSRARDSFEYFGQMFEYVRNETESVRRSQRQATRAAAGFPIPPEAAEQLVPMGKTWPTADEVDLWAPFQHDQIAEYVRRSGWRARLSRLGRRP